VGVVLHGGSYTPAIDGLRDGLRELGLEEGKQLVLHVRDTKGDLKSVGAAARNLEVKRATKTVPIAFYTGTDPVPFDLIQSYGHPGGRLTGLHGQSRDVTPKRLQLLKEMLPRLRRVVTFYNPDNPTAWQSVKPARDAARRLKVELIERPVASVEELRAGLRALRPGDVGNSPYWTKR
jgi:putative ABC transport system substrate-binding protein